MSDEKVQFKAIYSILQSHHMKNIHFAITMDNMECNRRQWLRRMTMNDYFSHQKGLTPIFSDFHMFFNSKHIGLHYEAWKRILRPSRGFLRSPEPLEHCLTEK